MRALVLVLLLAVLPSETWAGDALYDLYADGKYDEAMHQGAAAGTAAGYAIAARAALADASIKQAPCLECLQRAEAYARKAIAVDSRLSDAHVWLAAALGLEGRITGVIAARLHDTPAQAKAELMLALEDDAHNPYALAAYGAWHVEIVRTGGAFLARRLYGARLEEGLLLFDRAVKAGQGNVAVHYQIGLSLSGYDPVAWRDRIEAELTAATHAVPQTTYEKFIQGRAADLLTLLRQGARDNFQARVRAYQGYP